MLRLLRAACAPAAAATRARRALSAGAGGADSASSSGGGAPLDVLVLAEHDGRGALRPATHAALAAAAALCGFGGGGGGATLVVAGHAAHAATAAAAAAAAPGVRGVLLADSAALADGLAEPLAALLAALHATRPFTHLVAPASTAGRDAAPRAAGLLAVAPVTDVLRVLSPDTFVRSEPQSPLVLTVRAAAWPALPPRAADAPPAGISPVPAAALAAAEAEAARGGSAALSLDAATAAAVAASAAAPDLATASVVVAGGRGARDAAGFALLRALAAALPGGAGGAALGATRAAVDAGLAPPDSQVGQTGKVVAPRLYIAAGISGAIQHIAGMKDAGTIVAINKDPDAPLMALADVALEADLFAAVPELTRQLLAAQATRAP